MCSLWKLCLFHKWVRACRTTLQPRGCAFKTPKGITAGVITSFLFMIIVPNFPATADHRDFSASTQGILRPFLQTPHPLHVQSTCIPVIPRITFSALRSNHSPMSSSSLIAVFVWKARGGVGTWPDRGQWTLAAEGLCSWLTFIPTKPLLAHTAKVTHFWSFH